jgi:hypothetical protein
VAETTSWPALRKDPRFEKLLAKHELGPFDTPRSAPCCHSHRPAGQLVFAWRAPTLGKEAGRGGCAQTEEERGAQAGVAVAGGESRGPHVPVSVHDAWAGPSGLPDEPKRVPVVLMPASSAFAWRPPRTAPAALGLKIESSRSSSRTRRRTVVGVPVFVLQRARRAGTLSGL